MLSFYVEVAVFVFVCCLVVVLGSRIVVNQCLKEYLGTVGSLGLDSKYLEGLRLFANESNDHHGELHHVKIVLDVGLGSMWYSDVFPQMKQLNISGFDQFKRATLNCDIASRDRASAERENMIRAGSSFYLYSLGFMPQLPSGENWLQVLANYGNVKVLMNDVSDEEYYNNQYSASCKLEWQGQLNAHCFVPLIPLHHHHRINVTSSCHRLDHFSLDQVKVMLSAYRSLIKCIVSRENLFQFDLNQMPRVEYWRKLIAFLNIKLPASAPKYLSEGGSICDSVKLHNDKRHLKRVKCADEYSSTIASIYGERYRNFVRNLLLNSIEVPRMIEDKTNRLVLGIGPGTSGTRTVHFSAIQLNVTSLHYQFLYAPYPLNNSLFRHHFDFNMQALQMESADRRVFWSDTPVPNRWWYLYKLYPNTNFMITDVRNDTAWRENRFINHCNKTMVINEPSCTAPLPIRYDKSVLAMEFFRLSQIKIADVETVHRTYDAYRALAKCVIPSEKLWWVYLPELKSSEEYWTKLIALVGAKLSDNQKKEFIAKGIPRCGSAGCYWNGVKYEVEF